MSMYMDLTGLKPVSVITMGTYKGSTNPSNVVIDTIDSESGVLLITNCTAKTDSQTLSVTLCNNSDGTTGAVTVDSVLATNPECVIPTGGLTAFEALSATGLALVQIRNQGYRYVTVTCTGAGGTGATFEVIALVGMKRDVGSNTVSPTM